MVSRVELQSWMDSETFYVKVVGPMLRQKLGLDAESLHYWRVYACLKNFTDVVAIRDQRVNAEIMVNGKKLTLAVAGHMLNMLIISCVRMIDMYRYIAKVTMNVLAVSENNFEYEINMVDAGVNAERPMIGLWHNYYEYKMAIETYKLMCYHGLFNLREYEVKILEEGIEDLKKYPCFMGQSSTAQTRIDSNEPINLWSISLPELEYLCLNPLKLYKEKKRDHVLLG